MEQGFPKMQADSNLMHFFKGVFFLLPGFTFALDEGVLQQARRVTLHPLRKVTSSPMMLFSSSLPSP